MFKAYLLLGFKYGYGTQFSLLAGEKYSVQELSHSETTDGENFCSVPLHMIGNVYYTILYTCIMES